MKYSSSCNCINLRKASNNITKLYDSALANLGLKITQFSTLKNIQKLGKTNISDLSRTLELDRTTVLRNINKMIDLGLITYKYKNDDKIKVIQLTSVGQNRLREAIVVWEDTQHKYIKALGIKNYEEIDTLITKISKINI
ncbi:MarR family winged helix-turn-helix transcriptional regulator [Alphaproteobacteria bacterium]|nr:MarR family winged helix-turn-helix transcriptional regulator [Alphaproteobacteria bacterium]